MDDPHIPRKNAMTATATRSCTGCGYCTMFCVMDCILLQPDGFYTVDLDRCIGCRSCKVNCPFEAVIILPPKEDA